MTRFQLESSNIQIISARKAEKVTVPPDIANASIFLTLLKSTNVVPQTKPS